MAPVDEANLRDMFAALAMQALINKTGARDSDISQAAYALADAMLARRSNMSKRPHGGEPSDFDLVRPIVPL